MNNSRSLTRLFVTDPALEDRGARQMVIGVLSIALAVDVFMIVIDLNLWVMLGFGALLVGAVILAWRGHLTPGRLLVPLAGLAMFGYLMFQNFGLRDTAVLGLPVVLLSASLMIGRRGAAIYGLLSVALVTGLGVAESSGYIHNPMSVHNTPADYITTGVILVLITALQWLVIGRLNDNINSARRNEEAQRIANDALRTSEARQRALLSAIPELVFRIRRDGVFVDYHAPDVDRLAAPPEMFMGKPVQAVMPPHVAAQTLHFIEQVLTTGQPAQFEYALTMGEQLRHFDARMVISGADEVLATVRDIGERKQIEEDLKRYAAQARHRAEQLIMLNEVGRAVSTLRDLDGVLEVIHQQAQRSLPLDAFMIALLDAETSNHLWFGDQELHVAVVRDITDRKRVEEKLKWYAAQARQRAEQLIMLNEVGRAVSTLRDLDGVLEVIHKQAQRSLPLDAFMIALLDAQTNTLDFPFMHDSGQRWQEPPRPLDINSMMGRVIEQGQPYLLNRTPGELAQAELAQPLLGDTTKRSASLMYAPLRAGDRIIGVISVQSYTLNAYDQADLVLLEGIAHQAAIAIDNARLYSAVQQELVERQRAEQALRDSEALYQSLVEVMPMSVCRKDVNGRFTFVNQRYCIEFNLSPVEIIGKTDFDLHPRELAEKYQQDDRAVMAGGRTIEQVEEHEPIGGARVYVQTFKSPVYNARGEVTGTQIVFWDVTERQRAEARLYASEERYRLISTVISDYTFSTWLEPDGRLRLDWVAGAFELITGYPFDEYVARGGWLATLHPDDVAQDARDLARLRTNQPVVSEVRTIARDGGVRWVRVYAHPVWDQAKSCLIGIYGAVQDISERKQAEAERENLIRELETRNAELERYTYTVSHDLKSPLITIRGFLGFLEKDAVSGNIERLTADIKRISAAADRMQQLLNELLELSRIGRIVNPPQVVSFEQIAREAVTLVEGRLSARGVSVEIAPNLPPLYGDRARLVEVVQNLIDNAAKFMGDQPSPRITIGVEERDGEPVFFVADNGIGIDPLYHEKVFGLFNQLDAGAEGTGVGLALVKRIVEVHGGRIWVESQGQETGATFYFVLPVSH